MALQELSVTRRDLDFATLTLYGEARGEPPEGKVAVAWVIRNRAEWMPRTWWGITVGEVCTHCRQEADEKVCQFSCWNPADPNWPVIMDLEPDTQDYLSHLAIAKAVMAGALIDPTEGATHYLRLGTEAMWAKGRQPHIVIGHHAFYRLGPAA